MTDKKKILVVDDEQSIIELLTESLSYANYHSLTASNGEEAWDILQQNSDIRVILLDRMMPVMDGMAFLRKLKEHDLYQEVPVIMQTGASFDSHIKEGIDAGVFYYLVKPYNEEVLLAVLESALRDQEYKKKTIADSIIEERQDTLDKLSTKLNIELSNPLSVILCALQLLRRQSNNIDKEFIKNLDRAERNVYRCSAMLDRLVDTYHETNFSSYKVQLPNNKI